MSTPDKLSAWLQDPCAVHPCVNGCRKQSEYPASRTLAARKPAQRAASRCSPAAESPPRRAPAWRPVEPLCGYSLALTPRSAALRAQTGKNKVFAPGIYNQPAGIPGPNSCGKSHAANWRQQPFLLVKTDLVWRCASGFGKVIYLHCMRHIP